MIHKEFFGDVRYFLSQILFTFCSIRRINYFFKMNSNKDIFDRALGRPAMMAFILLVGTYVTTGQLIPGIY